MYAGSDSRLENPFGLIVSGSVIEVAERVLAFGVKEPEHTIHLVRWPVAGGHSEFTVHYEPLLAQYLEIQMVGFGQSDLGYRLSDVPEGTWAPIERFYRLEEYEIPDVLVYAAKAHPHLEGASLVLTYATNFVGYGQLVARDDLYYPRFLRAGFDNAREESSP
jgi:hypothetical protein